MSEMFRSGERNARFLVLLILAAMALACMPAQLLAAPTPSLPPTEGATPPLPPPAASPSAGDKWSLWTNGSQLRGANIYQRRVFPELDGTEFYGPGPFGPPYTQQDFNHLAALGANYVNISTAGLFTVQPPYGVDEEAVASLDQLLELAAAADLFAVITFRTGPGRSEFTLIGDESWPPERYIINTVWTDPAARQAWAEMWLFTAERYRHNPIVVGYDLMCEPNSNAIFDLWEPDDFYAQYAGTGYDWNAWYPNIVSAIRAVDPSTPILVGGNGYSAVEWLPYLQRVDDPHVVYTIHQYAPHAYTHLESPSPALTYPGTFDTDYDGEPDTFDRAWLESLLLPVADFSAQHQVPVAVNEYGAVRWVPGAAEYIRAEMDFFDQFGWNYAVWQWQPDWPPLAEGDHSFNFRFGPDPANLVDVDNEWLSVYTAAWSRNAVRPGRDWK